MPSSVVYRRVLLSCLLAGSACADDVEGAVDATGTPGSTGTPTGTANGSEGADTSGGDGVDTTGGNDSGAIAESGEATETGTQVGDPVVVVVGYGGMRARSFDAGRSWQDYVQEADAGGDDVDALRGVTFGNGRFVAVGWRIFGSPDGATWTEHENPHPVWYGAVAFGNERFVAVGGEGRCAASSDGQVWTPCADVNGEASFDHVRSVLFHDGRFWAADGSLHSSLDGEGWQLEDPGFGSPWIAAVGGQVVALPPEAPAELADARLRGIWDTGIQRADPGSDGFVTVFEIPGGNNVFDANRFAFAAGFAAP